MLKLRELRTSSPSAFALIVGVSSYRAFDPSGGEHLPGARNDAIAWWRQLVLTLGFSPEQVHVLASPALSIEELGRTPKEQALAKRSPRGSASQHGILDAYDHLLDAVSSHPESMGAFIFAGHGSTHLKLQEMKKNKGYGLVLCPSDYAHTEEGGLTQGIDIVESLFKRRNVAVTQRISYFLDCCYATEASGAHSRTGARQHRSRGLPHTVEGRRLGGHVPQRLSFLELPHRDLRGRIMLAAHLQNFAHEVQIGGEPRGAWSWAMICFMEQWKTAPIFPGADQHHPQVRYRDLDFACRSQLALLNLPQVPTLVGLPDLGDLIVFQSGQKPPTSDLSDIPDGGAVKSQLTGNLGGTIQYEISAVLEGTMAPKTVGMILAGNSQSDSSDVLMESWSATNTDALTQLVGAKRIEISTIGALYWDGWANTDGAAYQANVSNDVAFTGGEDGPWTVGPNTETWQWISDAQVPCAPPWKQTAPAGFASSEASKFSWYEGESLWINGEWKMTVKIGFFVTETEWGICWGQLVKDGEDHKGVIWTPLNRLKSSTTGVRAKFKKIDNTLKLSSCPTPDWTDGQWWWTASILKP